MTYRYHQHKHSDSHYTQNNMVGQIKQRTQNLKVAGFHFHCQSCVEVSGKLLIHIAPVHLAVMSTQMNVNPTSMAKIFV